MTYRRYAELTPEKQRLKNALKKPWYWYPNHGGGAIRHYSNGIGIVTDYSTGPGDNRYWAERNMDFSVHNESIGAYDTPEEAIRAVEDKFADD